MSQLKEAYEIAAKKSATDKVLLKRLRSDLSKSLQIVTKQKSDIKTLELTVNEYASRSSKEVGRLKSENDNLRRKISYLNSRENSLLKAVEDRREKMKSSKAKSAIQRDLIHSLRQVEREQMFAIDDLRREVDVLKEKRVEGQNLESKRIDSIKLIEKAHKRHIRALNKQLKTKENLLAA